MPYFTPEDLDIEPSEYLDSCSKWEIKELIEELVKSGHLPKNVLNQLEASKNYSRLEVDFSEKLDKLSKRYHSISREDEDKLEEIFKKYL